MGWLPIIERIDSVADVVLEDRPMRMFIKVDDFKATSCPICLRVGMRRGRREL